jgi:antitoxin component of MazEF toxin-antitoxin module
MENTENQTKVRKVQPIHGNTSFVLVIPKEFIVGLNISKGDYVKCILVDDSLVVKKVKV